MAKKTSPDKPLRFAALIRVSTEAQANRGESLNTQTKQIEAAVKSLGGVITKQYKGQQHATAGYEHKLVEEMLTDARKKRKPFDAVMVADPSRWSRDNASNDAKLATLRENGVRFFTLTTEHDLHNPDAVMYLSMSAVFNQYHANVQTKKSIENKIERAKRGPSAGSLPFGRTYDKETEKWGIDEEKRALVVDCANRYLNGESIKNLAAEYGMDYSNLHSILTKKCGDRWVQTFKSDKFNINESVEIHIPRLLPDATIKKILKKVERQRKFVRGKNKNKYLLAGKVFCEQCGRALSPQNTNDTRYYRPAVACKCFKGAVRAEDLERCVARQLFATMGNPKAVAEAIEEAQPDKAKLAGYRKRLEVIESELAKIEKARNRILGLIEKDALTDAQAESKLAEIKEREHKLEDERDSIQSAIQFVPNRKAIDKLSAKLSIKVRGIRHDFDAMTWDQCREMVMQAFEGMTEDGRPMGVFVEPIPGYESKRPRPFAYTLRGHFAVDGGGHTGLNTDVLEDWQKVNDLSSY